MCAAIVVGSEQHVVLNCAGVRHVRDMYPQLEFSQPTLSLHAHLMYLYQFRASVVRFAEFVVLPASTMLFCFC